MEKQFNLKLLSKKNRNKKIFFRKFQNHLKNFLGLFSPELPIQPAVVTQQTFTFETLFELRMVVPIIKMLQRGHDVKNVNFQILKYNLLIHLVSIHFLLDLNWVFHKEALTNLAHI